MNLLKQGALERGMEACRIHLIAGEAEATAASLAAAGPGDLVVVTPSEVEAAWEQVVGFRKAPAPFLSPTLVAAE